MRYLDKFTIRVKRKLSLIKQKENNRRTNTKNVKLTLSNRRAVVRGGEHSTSCFLQRSSKYWRASKNWGA